MKRAKAKKVAKAVVAPRAQRPKRAGRPKKDGNTLDLDRIIEAAWKVVDRDGLGALSTRKVAAELDVKSPALYWHIKSKQELLGLMTESVVRKSIGSMPRDLPWWEYLRSLAREQYRSMLGHRDSGQMWSIAPPAEQMRTELLPQAMVPLLQAGISRADSAAAIGALASFVVGSLIYEQNPATRALAALFNDPERTFESGLDCLIIGLRHKAGASRKP